MPGAEKLRRLIFMALCCDLGMLAKKLVLPAADLVTDALHIPGGIGTSFSLLFIVVAAVLVPGRWRGIQMGLVQSVLALALGAVGSMGALAPLGYLVPGAVIDLVLLAAAACPPLFAIRALLATAAASVAACLTANAIVFHLAGPALLLYACVAAVSGSVCGALADLLAERLAPVIQWEGKTWKKAKSKD